MKKILIAIVTFFAFASVVHAAYPGYSGYVNDNTNTLTTAEVQKLETKLTEYDKQTTNQIAVLIVKTTEPETIEEYGIHIFDLWKMGVKGKDNGVLMTFAMADHKMRIDVGRGLEGSLTDLQSKDIIDNVISPDFKAGQYYTGIDKGIDKIIVAVSPDSPIASVAAKAMNDDGSSAGGVILLIIVVIFIIVLLVAISPYTPLGGEGTWGITGGWSPSDGDDSGFGGFGGGISSGGGASGSW
jgi:uncharacterized protein